MATGAFGPPRGFGPGDEGGTGEGGGDGGEGSTEASRRERWDLRARSLWGVLFREAVDACRAGVFQGAASDPAACKFATGGFAPDEDWDVFVLGPATDCAACAKRAAKAAKGDRARLAEIEADPDRHCRATRGEMEADP